MNAPVCAEDSFPMRYRLYTPVHRAFTSLGTVTVGGKHPFIVLRNHLNRLMYRYALTARETRTVQTRDGFAMKVPLDDQAAASIVFNRQYAAEEGEVLRRLLAGRDAFLDVGANLGYFSLLALQTLRGRGPVVSIEPNQKLCSLIRESIALNKFTMGTVRQAAVGGEPGRAWFVVDPKRTSHGQVSLAAPEGESVEIEIARVDDVLKQQGMARNWLIKIDVEGLEAQVLSGCVEAMRSGAVFMCEVFAHSAPGFAAILKQQDYALLDHRGVLLSASQLERQRRQDVILTPANQCEKIQRCLALN